MAVSSKYRPYIPWHEAETLRDILKAAFQSGLLVGEELTTSELWWKEFEMAIAVHKAKVHIENELSD